MSNIAIENFLKMSPEIPQYTDKNQHYLIAGANPTYYLDDTGTQEEQFAPLMASLAFSKLSPTLITNYDESHLGINLGLGNNGGYVKLAQTFHNPTQIVLSNVQFFLAKQVGSPAGNATVSIYAVTGSLGTTSKPTGSALATSDNVGVGGFSSGADLAVNFIFSGVNKITLNANTNYAIVLSYTSGTSASIAVGAQLTAVYNGNESNTSDGVNWNPDSGVSLIFYIYGGGIIPTPIEGGVVNIISDTEGTYSAFIITSTTRVYGITPTSIADLGYPSGSSSNYVGGRLAIAGGNLYASIAGAVYYMPLPFSGWTLVGGGSLSSPGGIHFLEPFLDFMVVANAPSGDQPYRLLDKIDITAQIRTSTPTQNTLDLGKGWGILGVVNYNNKYLAVAGGRTSGSGIFGYPQNYLFLWDGISLKQNYSVKIPGKYISMKVIDSILYVSVEVSAGKTKLYFLYNTILKEVFTQQYSTISDFVGGSNAPVSDSIFNYKNNVGLRLDDNNSDSLIAPLMIYGKQEVGQSEFIINSGLRLDQFTVGYDGILYASVFNPGIPGDIYIYPSSGSYNQILYKSHWIPVKNLQAIDIYYDSPPQGGTDAINVTIYGQGEDYQDSTSQPVSYTLDSITPSKYLTTKRTRLDVKGFTGDQLKIVLSTVNTGTWRPKINKIVPIVK
jgi:hypothetical protein